jgi:hypothetical protein
LVVASSNTVYGNMPAGEQTFFLPATQDRPADVVKQMNTHVSEMEIGWVAAPNVGFTTLPLADAVQRR